MREKKVAGRKIARHADEPGQAVNVDLCFVPLVHGQADKLPAVSGSSGRLVIEPSRAEKAQLYWPGQVFEQAEVSFEAAMESYALQTRDRLKRGKLEPILSESEPTDWRKSWEGRAERHAILQQRRQEDEAWRIERQAHHQIVVAYRAFSRRKRIEQEAEWQAEKMRWANREQARLALLVHRKVENQAWHEKNRTRLCKPEMVWVAVLVVTDNCSRRCFGLPIFEAGAKVTAREIQKVLQILLPQELAFLISDQGSHFRNNTMAAFAQETGFIHIPIYRHRPQTNGIAERFVRSLKEWLYDFSWTDAQRLTALLSTFCQEYNHRPHQGLPIPGLSPIEFENRIWLM